MYRVFGAVFSCGQKSLCVNYTLLIQSNLFIMGNIRFKDVGLSDFIAIFAMPYNFYFLLFTTLRHIFITCIEFMSIY